MDAVRNAGEERRPLITQHLIANGNSSSHYGYGSTFVVPISLASDDVCSYKRRWWILAVFTLCCATQSALWNAWTPIADAVQIAFNWDSSIVAMAPAITMSALAFSGFPMMHCMRAKGLRVGTLLCAGLLLTCTALWNFAAGLEQSWLVMVGAVFNGVAGSVTMATPALLSVTWFPVNERMKATSIGYLGNAFGAGLSFIVGPYLSGPDVTEWHIQHKANLTAGFKQSLRWGIENTMCFNAGVALLCLLCVLIYFPAKPPSPPSVSATVSRMDFWTGLKHLIKNRDLFLLLVAFTLPLGSYYAWISMVSVNFRDLGVSQAMAGWIGFASIASSAVGSVLLSAFVDNFKRQTKLLVLSSCLVSIISTTVLACVHDRCIYLPEVALTGALYLLSMIIGLCILGVVPLYFELGCEMAYPVHEGLTCSYIMSILSVCETVYLLVFLNPALVQDTHWMTWTLLGTCVLSLIVLVPLRDSYSRLELDDRDE